MKKIPIHKRTIIEKPPGVKIEHLGKEKSTAKIVVTWRRNFEFDKVIKRNLGDISSIIGENVSYLLNKTIITIDNKMFKIEHKPLDSLPWTYYRKETIKGFEIKRIPGEEIFSKVMHGIIDTLGLYVHLKNGEEALLLYNLKKNTLQYLAQELEILLDVEDIIPKWE